MKKLLIAAALSVAALAGCKKEVVVVPAPAPVQVAPAAKPVVLGAPAEVKVPSTGGTVSVLTGGGIRIDLTEDPSQNLKWRLVPGSEAVAKPFNEDGESKKTFSATNQVRSFHLHVLSSGDVTLVYTNASDITQVQQTVVIHVNAQ